MKILFVLKQRNYLHTFSGVVRELTRRGHAVRLAWPDDDTSLTEDLEPGSVTVDKWIPKRNDAWGPLVVTTRRARDYLRYLDPAYSGANKLRARAFEKLLYSLSRGERDPEPAWAEVGLALTKAERQRLLSITTMLETAIPSDPRQEALIEADRPDVVLVSPLIDLGSAQTDIVKSALHLGIPTGMVLFSWDNLSTKGGLHAMPDRMFVWNERQRHEALALHGYPLARTIATGAPRLDEFFALRPSSSRRDFLEPLGLDPDRPTLMYLGSSIFVISFEELPFIREWVTQIRQSANPALRDCNIIVRPHPDVKAWEGEEAPSLVRWSGTDGKGFVTRPFNDARAVVVRSRYRRAQAFYDALHHSSAVIGLNTSAALEAAIVGRPVFTILAGDDVANGQTSTLHFHYLLAEHGGCVTPAATFEDHLRQLADTLAGPDQSERVRTFAREFVRPGDPAVPASVVLASAIEQEFGGQGGRPAGQAVLTRAD